MSIYKERRPWGSFYVLDEGEAYKIKRIVVNPSGRLSLQSHNHRAEHWVVTKGNAKISVGDEVYFYQAGQYIFIPLGAKHRLENMTDDDVEIVEIQCGHYLGEDDIVRYEDMYARV